MIRNNKGFIFLSLTTVALLLAIVGIWYMHRAYVSGSFGSDISAMISDGKSTAKLGASPPDGGGEMAKAREAISSILSKYKTKIPAGAAYMIPQNTNTQAPAQGGYYGQQ